MRNPFRKIDVPAIHVIFNKPKEVFGQITAYPKHFSTGSNGFHGKAHLIIDGEPYICHVNIIKTATIKPKKVYDFDEYDNEYDREWEREDYHALS